MLQDPGRSCSRIRLPSSRLLDFLTVAFVFIYIPGLFLRFNRAWEKPRASRAGGPRYPAISTHNSSLSLGVCQETGSPGAEIKVGFWDCAGFLRLALRSGQDNRNGSRPAV